MSQPLSIADYHDALTIMFAGKSFQELVSYTKTEEGRTELNNYLTFKWCEHKDNCKGWMCTQECKDMKTLTHLCNFFESDNLDSSQDVSKPNRTDVDRYLGYPESQINYDPSNA